RYDCGDYTEVNVYPVFRMQKSRGKRAKPTGEAQARLNQLNAERKLVRLLNANFTDDDVELHLTYSDDNLPADDAAALRDVQNFIRRVKRLRKKLGLPELKYINVTEGGVDGTRYHHHMTLSGGIDRTELEKLWGYGYANSRALQFSEEGLEGLAKYITKSNRAHADRLAFRKRWTASKNLIRPEPKERDGRISAKRVEELATFDSGNRAAFERLYPGYYVAGVSAFHNDVNGGYYLHIRLYRQDAKFCRRHRR
ncbi:MAG: hypothetical protein ACI3XR_02520, partial [Eubacteriales bacterium]